MLLVVCSLTYFFCFFFLRHSLVFAPVYNRPAVTESFERIFTSNFVYTGSNVSMNSMAEAGNTSRAMSGAPCDDVSFFLLSRGSFQHTL